MKKDRKLHVDKIARQERLATRRIGAEKRRARWAAYSRPYLEREEDAALRLLLLEEEQDGWEPIYETEEELELRLDASFEEFLG